jgi:hypothetical protein
MPLFRRGRRADNQAAIESEPTRPCPFCKEPVSRGATVCLHCERDIVPVMPADEFANRFGPTIPLKQSE